MASRSATGEATRAENSSGGKSAAAVPVMARCIDHVNLSVRDLDASVDFYSRLLGVEIKEQDRTSEVPWCILGAPGKFYVCMFECPKGEPFRPNDIHINHVGFVVDDMDETVRRIHDLGFKLQFNDATVQWPRSRSAYVADPDGILLEFTERFGGGLD